MPWPRTHLCPPPPPFHQHPPPTSYLCLIHVILTGCHTLAGSCKLISNLNSHLSSARGETPAACCVYSRNSIKAKGGKWPRHSPKALEHKAPAQGPGVSKPISSSVMWEVIILIPHGNLVRMNPNSTINVLCQAHGKSTVNDGQHLLIVIIILQLRPPRMSCTISRSDLVWGLVAWIWSCVKDEMAGNCLPSRRPSCPCFSH